MVGKERRKAPAKPLVWCLITLMLGTPAVMCAQSVWPTSLEFAVGPAVGWGGSYEKRTGTGYSFAITGRHHSAASIGLGLGYAKIGAGSGDCLVSPDDVMTCTNDFPSTYHGAILFGLSHRRGLASFRVFGGPAVFVGEELSGFGPHTQADAAIGKGRVELMVGYRVSAIFRMQGDTQGVGSAMFGLRVH